MGDQQSLATMRQDAVVAGLPEALEPFTPLHQAIADVARGDEQPRAPIEAALAQLEQRGLHLTAAVQAIWRGQRDPAALTQGLDASASTLVRRVLALLARDGPTA